MPAIYCEHSHVLPYIYSSSLWCRLWQNVPYEAVRVTTQLALSHQSDPFKDTPCPSTFLKQPRLRLKRRYPRIVYVSPSCFSISLFSFSLVNFFLDRCWRRVSSYIVLRPVLSVPWMRSRPWQYLSDSVIHDTGSHTVRMKGASVVDPSSTPGGWKRCTRRGTRFLPWNCLVALVSFRILIEADLGSSCCNVLLFSFSCQLSVWFLLFDLIWWRTKRFLKCSASDYFVLDSKKDVNNFRYRTTRCEQCDRARVVACLMQEAIMARTAYSWSPLHHQWRCIT